MNTHSVNKEHRVAVVNVVMLKKVGIQATQLYHDHIYHPVEKMEERKRRRERERKRERERERENVSGGGE